MAEAKPKEEPKVTTLKLERDSRLHFGRLQEAEQARRHHFADIPAGGKVDDLLDPKYWRHHVKVIRPLDLIEAFCEDGSWEAMFRVMFVGANEIRLSTLSIVEHEDPADVAPLSEDYDVTWKGPVAKYAVVNKQNGMIIKDRLYPKSEAVAFLKNHMGRMKA